MTIHTFADTGDAYDACQCDETIATGDVLLITEEGVIGLAGAWPIAITAEAGELHEALPGQLRAVLDEQGMSTGLEAALRLAAEHGYDLNHDLKGT